MQAERRALWTALWKMLDQTAPTRQLPAISGPAGLRAGLGAAAMARGSPFSRRASASPLPLSASPTASASPVVSRVAPDATAPSAATDGGWLSGVLLAVWDNVTGPRVEHAWLSAGGLASAVAPEQLHEIARDALAGTLEDSLVVKLVALPHGGGVVFSVAFTAPFGDDALPAKFSLAAFAPPAALSRALVVHRVVEDRLMHLALATRSVLTRCPDLAVERLGPEVSRAVSMLESAVARCVISAPLAVISADTGSVADAFGRAVYAAAVAFGVELLARALTSHLQTRGFTVVIGPDEASVCAVVDTLSVFLFDAHDRALSSRTGSLYHPDLVLQGVVATLESSGVSEEHLIQAPLPTTVVDLSSIPRNVWQPRSAAEYAVARREFFKLALSTLASNPLQQRSATTVPSPLFPAAPQPQSPLVGSGSAAAEAASMPELPELDMQHPPRPMVMFPNGAAGSGRKQEWAPKEGLLAQVSQSSALVLDLLCATLRLPIPLRLPYVRHVCHGLTAKAVSLLKLVASDIRVHKGSTEGSGRWLKDNLGLQDDADLNVIFAFAERLSPGFCSSIIADRLTLEEKFIELFEGFV